MFDVATIFLEASNITFCLSTFPSPTKAYSSQKWNLKRSCQVECFLVTIYHTKYVLYNLFLKFLTYTNFVLAHVKYILQKSVDWIVWKRLIKSRIFLWASSVSSEDVDNNLFLSTTRLRFYCQRLISQCFLVLNVLCPLPQFMEYWRMVGLSLYHQTCTKIRIETYVIL